MTRAKGRCKVQQFAQNGVLTLTKTCQNGVFKIISQKSKTAILPCRLGFHLSRNNSLLVGHIASKDYMAQKVKHLVLSTDDTPQYVDQSLSSGWSAPQSGFYIRKVIYQLDQDIIHQITFFTIRLYFRRAVHQSALLG